MRFRHIARGSTYQLLADRVFLHLLSKDGSMHQIGANGEMAELQCSVAKANDSLYGGEVCLYQCEQDNKLYLRPRSEFFDPERFENLND